MRDLKAKGQLEGNRLLCSNKTGKDVIMEEDFKEMLGQNFISTLTREDKSGHEHGRIDKHFMKDHVDEFSQHFYVCGPEKMVKDINEQLQQLGAETDSLVFEK